jgi:hypothetical protein
VNHRRAKDFLRSSKSFFLISDGVMPEDGP